MNSAYLSFAADSKGKVQMSTIGVAGEGNSPDAAVTDLYKKLSLLPAHVVILNPTNYEVTDFVDDQLPF